MENLHGTTVFMSENGIWSVEYQKDNNNSAETEKDNEHLNVNTEKDNEHLNVNTEICSKDIELPQKRRKSSFVWGYFRETANTKSLECIICNSSVSNLTSNLARHLLASHNITRSPFANETENNRRATRSYIWKYCTKENARHARCNLCKKLLYFGSGSTSNISKHLERRHAHIVGSIQKQNRIVYRMDDLEKEKNDILDQKKRKGGSYVWKYCEKISRHTVRCKLCLKIMSFHGTANVITHLQRKHNVLGRGPVTPATDITTAADSNHAENSDMLINSSTGIVEECLENLDNSDNADRTSTIRRGPKNPGASLVWKYCKRVGLDVVRCIICNKNLSNQGTSNLQRHLHRMHGIVMPGRELQIYDKSYKDEVNDEFIWQHCKLDDDDNYRCNMCTVIFPKNKNDDIIKHLLITHAVKIKVNTSNYKKVRRHVKNVKSYTETESTGDDDDDDEVGGNDENLNKSITSMGEDDGQTLNYGELDIKKDYEDYDVLVENADTEGKPFVAEEPIDPEILPQSNPLSPNSSRGDSPELHGDKRAQYHNFNENKKMQKLNEERVRMETEYYREKAGFYRMQKYLTALQAKKVRAELERFYKEETTTTTANNVIGVDSCTNFTYNLGAHNKIV